MSAFHELQEIFTKAHYVKHFISMGHWDSAAKMPEGSSGERSKALAELGAIHHEILTDKKIADLLESASNEDLNFHDNASLKEMKRVYLDRSVLPADLVKKKVLTESRCEMEWRTQRKENDWRGFSKNLKEVIALTREEAQIRSEMTGLSLYDSLLDKFEPEMKSAEIDDIFNNVKTWLPGLIKDICEKQKSESFIAPKGPFLIKNQNELALNVMKKLGFNFNKGRVDVSIHPFCGGVPEDVRITTRYDEDDFTQGLMGIIHETGHACYEQNLPRDLIHLPVGSARSMGIHEGQSLLYEMQLGRSKEFLSSIREDIVKAFGDDKAFEINNLYTLYTRVKPDYIRVDADEVTYAAHVILRYEIEKEIIENNLNVDDIPDMWNEKMMEYLGVDTKGNYKDGPMQDIHWTGGAFGYFPCYTLGAMYAAQLFSKIKEKHKNIYSDISNGDYSKISTWLKENVWNKGSSLSTNDLIKEATGEVLNPEFFKNHLKERYL